MQTSDVSAKHVSVTYSNGLGRRRDPPVRGAGYEPFDSILFRIEVRKAKRSQSDAVRTKLGRCVVMKAAVQSFHPRDNTLPTATTHEED